MESIILAATSSAWLDYLGPVALKGAGLLAAALLVGLVLQLVSAARRYVLWFTAVMAVGALTIAAPLLPSWRVLPAREASVVMETPTRAEEADAASVAEEPAIVPTDERVLPSVVTNEPAPMQPPTLRWPMISRGDVVASLPLVWLVIAVALSFRLIISGVRLGLLRKKSLAREVPSKLSTALTSLVAGLGSTAPRLLIGPAGSVPMVWGILRPCLLLPADAIEWSEKKLRSVLLHELAHLRRRDPAALLIAQIVQSLHWFNPLAWLTVRRLRADQERACDDMVLRHGVRASDYAQHLLDISQHHRLAPGFASCALAMARYAPVERRLAAILNPKVNREATTCGTFVFAVALAALIAAPLAMVANEAAKGLRGRILDRNGVVLAESTQEKLRHYPLRNLAAHVIGCTGKSSPKNFTPEGREGIELTQNETLKRGDDLTLTLDARVQSLAERELSQANRNGSIVVLDAVTSEVLAMASWPSYDLNAFIPSLSIDTFDALAKDTGLPLFPRAFRAEYPPGSVFKLVTALAGIADGKEASVFKCDGVMMIGGRTFRDWTKEGHGQLTLEDSLVRSCNLYSCQMAIAVGQDKLSATAESMGFGAPTGLPLKAEAKGTFQTNAFMQERYGRPVPAGDTASMSIGQGRSLASPVQMALAANVIANGGRTLAPILVPGRSGRTPLSIPGLSPEQCEIVRRAMKRSVSEDGIAMNSRSSLHEIAATTGTSQWKLRQDSSKNQNLASLAGFAPYNEPKIAFAIVVEGKPGEVISGGQKCGPMAKRIVEEVLALPADGSGKVVPVATEEIRKAEPTKADEKPMPPAQDKDSNKQLRSYLLKTKDPLYPFLEKHQDKPGQFQVRLRRVRYFEDDVPGLDGKECFEIQPMTVPPGQGYVGMVFVPKSSPLAVSLAEGPAWESVGAEADVTLKWREDQDKKWVEVMEVRDIKHTSPPANDAKPDKGKEKPADDPDLRRKTMALGDEKTAQCVPRMRESAVAVSERISSRLVTSRNVDVASLGAKGQKANKLRRCSCLRCVASRDGLA